MSTSIEVSVLDLPCGPVEVHAIGDGDELWVVLHASATGAGSLRGLAKSLAASSRRVVVPALSGYGETFAATDDPLSANAAIAIALLDHYDAKQRILFGHSMGGLAAVHAVELGANVNALALYEPILIGALDSQNAQDMALLAWDQAIIAELNKAVDAGEPERGVAAFVRGWNEIEWEELPARTQEQLVAAAPRLVAETRTTASAGAPTARCNALNLPVVVLRGTSSPALTRALAERFAAKTTHGVVNPIENVGHMAPVLSPDEVARHLDEWLKSTGPAK